MSQSSRGKVLQIVLAETRKHKQNGLLREVWVQDDSHSPNEEGVVLKWPCEIVLQVHSALLWVLGMWFGVFNPGFSR